jgi:hypothetical protein
MRASLAFAVASLLGLTLIASAAEARQTDAMTIKVVSVLTSFGQTDVEPKGLSAGDRVKMTDRLYNAVPQFGKAKGVLVGSDSATLTILAGGRTASFRGVARIPGGSVVVRGVVAIAGQGSTKVVGGTGRFATATGRLVVGPASKNGRAVNVFYLTLH